MRRTKKQRRRARRRARARKPSLRGSTRSPLKLARLALAAARAALPAYSSRFSRRDYTQHQLLALLVLREFLRTDYRGLVALLEDWSDLRRALGLARVPHYSTLCYAQRRLLKKGGSTGSWPPASPRPAEAA